MTNDIHVTEGSVLETLNNKVDLDGGNYPSSGLERYIDKTLNTRYDSKYLNKTQITNCLLEVPQNIKLELKDGVITLKAGSKVIVPNGFEADGITPKFDYITVEWDVTDAYKNGYVGKWLLYYSLAHNRLLIREVHTSYSGTTAPSGYAFWYDTTNNKVVRQENDGVWQDTLSLPIAEVTMGSDGSWTSINQVFNGMGYIGSTVWVDKGVKGLIPNGRNEDGTLNNAEFVTKHIMPKSFTGTTPFVLGINQDGISIDYVYFYSQEDKPTAHNYIWYKPSKNTLTDFLGNNKYGCVCIYATRTDGKIDSFQQKQPFRAVDYNDKSEIISWNMPDYNAKVALAKTNGTAPLDGYIKIGSISNVASFNFTIADSTFTLSGNYQTSDMMLVPISKGETYTCANWSGIATLEFIPLKGVN